MTRLFNAAWAILIHLVFSNEKACVGICIYMCKCMRTCTSVDECMCVFVCARSRFYGVYSKTNAGAWRRPSDFAQVNSIPVITRDSPFMIEDINTGEKP